ncbi:unnamed protein product [Dimorphilus gyrociliatus]|uniref:Uncharacterized protein n=1 Tax=Dimorphilus gyrociliatus TaxID=2664684 RepID=A0A7I8VXZ8_9ANNE|nr:unnamed protein product [Dimorphilus gyrociliatus]
MTLTASQGSQVSAVKARPHPYEKKDSESSDKILSKSDGSHIFKLPSRPVPLSKSARINRKLIGKKPQQQQTNGTPTPSDIQNFILLVEKFLQATKQPNSDFKKGNEK